MATISYLLQQPYKKGQSKKEGKKTLNPNDTRIYLWLIVSRNEKLKVKTDEKIKPAHWDFDKQRMKSQVSGNIEFNRRLSKLKLAVEENYRRIINDTPGITFPEIAANIRAFVRTNHIPIFDDKNKDIWTVFEEYLDSKSHKVTYRTVQKYRTLQSSLREFCDLHYTGFGFRSIDLLFIEKYILHLQSQKPRGRQKSREDGRQVGLLNDSIAKYIDNFKNFLKWSFERGYHENDIFKHKEFAVKRNSVNDIVTLTLPELKALYEFDFSNDIRLERVRDVFCFGCFTGQRWSDIENFNSGQIKNDCWVFTSLKTKKETHIPLIGYSYPALDILNKYGYNLPIISSQKFNEYLKEAGEIAGLDRLVKIRRFIGTREIEIEKPLFEFMSSHMARRTCVSILLNVERMPITLVQQITQHGDLKTLQKYIDKDIDALRIYLEQSKGIQNSTFIKVVKSNAG